jgi:hypothetical protein
MMLIHIQSMLLYVICVEFSINFEVCGGGTLEYRDEVNRRDVYDRDG